MTALTAAFLLPPQASAASAPVSAELTAHEKEGCINNLQTIYLAIEAYRRDHKDVPNSFTDLVPDYLPDINMLVCPMCRRTGKTEDPRLADPDIPSSYLYEFSAIPLGKAAPANPKATRRDWKRRQMEVVGTIVPLATTRSPRRGTSVRCRRPASSTQARGTECGRARKLSAISRWRHEPLRAMVNTLTCN